MSDNAQKQNDDNGMSAEQLSKELNTLTTMLHELLSHSQSQAKLMVKMQNEMKALRAEMNVMKKAAANGDKANK